ncbi:MAG: hypothetical protein KJ063_08785 [Anaerolineae bacterium]|nr:hypothetical protein [Anaerolineae bacterium]
MNKLAYAFGKDVQRRFLIQIIAVVIGLPVGLVFVLSALCTVSFLSDSSDSSLFISLLLYLGPMALLLVGGTVGGIYYPVRQRGRWLDEIFAPLEVTGTAYALTGRQYDGLYQGRPLRARFYRGPGLLLQLGAETHTRLAAAAQKAIIPQLARYFNGSPLEHNAPGLSGITIFAYDPHWGQQLVQQPEVQDALQQLINGPSGFLFQQVHIRPGAVYLQLHRTAKMVGVELTAEQVVTWTELLARLAAAAEQLPSPVEKLTLTPLEARMQQSNPNPGLIMAGIGLGLFLTILCVAAAITLPLILANN